jgi:DNA recombination protein RmuC
LKHYGPTPACSSVRQLWRFEEQNAHTAQLAESAAKVYKKLNTFLQSMQSLGKQLDGARDFYGRAMGQLYSGKGNLINLAHDFERLCVSVQAGLPDELVAKAALEIDHVPALPDIVEANVTARARGFHA